MKKDLKRGYVLSVAINNHELEMLEKISEDTKRTKSEVVRELIRQEFEGRFRNVS
jgi:predicted DNA-binding protein